MRVVLIGLVVVLIVACGNDPSGIVDPGPAPVDAPSDEGGVDELPGDPPPDPQSVQLVATGPLSGEFSTTPRCDTRTDDDGPYLHVFFAFYDESTAEIPTINVVLKLRPVDHQGPFALSGEDLEVEYRHGDFSNKEVLDASVDGTVTRSTAASGLPLALIDFSVSYQGVIGEGKAKGSLSCFATE